MNIIDKISVSNNIYTIQGNLNTPSTRIERVYDGLSTVCTNIYNSIVSAGRDYSTYLLKANSGGTTSGYDNFYNFYSMSESNLNSIYNNLYSGDGTTSRIFKVFIINNDTSSSTISNYKYINSSNNVATYNLTLGPNGIIFFELLVPGSSVVYNSSDNSYTRNKLNPIVTRSYVLNNNDYMYNNGK